MKRAFLNGFLHCLTGAHRGGGATAGVHAAEADRTRRPTGRAAKGIAAVARPGQQVARQEPEQGWQPPCQLATQQCAAPLKKGKCAASVKNGKFMLFRDALAAQTARIQWLAIHNVHTGVSGKLQQRRMQDMVPLRAPKNEKGLPHS